MSNTPHSQRCHDLTTFWDPAQRKCIPCSNTPIKPGHEITPNCGRDDDGGRHEPTIKPCKTNTFNNGSSFHCKPCSTCQRRFQTERPCNTTADTVCETGKQLGDVMVSLNRRGFSSKSVCVFHYLFYGLISRHNKSAFLFKFSLFYLQTFIPPHPLFLFFCRIPTTDFPVTVSADILSAPLQTVLDNLDVLEELVILLDPESHVRKSTKHLASHCAFPSTWITYTYSMKDSKSPLKAVLEGVTCKNPDWTVGHLAKLLKHMERNDAIAALAKLKTNKTEV
uniref:IGF-like family receptor 1 n=1 Tax=Neolamprologus brichardi TaxID=32507 RepID=A0A3Q4HTL3_NEOBR